MRTALNACLVTLLFLVAGCGSFSSHWRGDRGPYVGVKLAAETATHFTTEGELIAIFDIPLSAVADTFFLPYDLAAQEPSARNDSPTNASGSARIGYKR